MKDIPEENRPRERMRRNGVNVLSDAELLAIVLQNGTKGENVVDMIAISVQKKEATDKYLK